MNDKRQADHFELFRNGCDGFILSLSDGEVELNWYLSFEQAGELVTSIRDYVAEHLAEHVKDALGRVVEKYQAATEEAASRDEPNAWIDAIEREMNGYTNGEDDDEAMPPGNGDDVV